MGVEKNRKYNTTHVLQTMHVIFLEGWTLPLRQQPNFIHCKSQDKITLYLVTETQYEEFAYLGNRQLQLKVTKIAKYLKREHRIF